MSVQRRSRAQAQHRTMNNARIYTSSHFRCARASQRHRKIHVCALTTTFLLRTQLRAGGAALPDRPPERITTAPNPTHTTQTPLLRSMRNPDDSKSIQIQPNQSKRIQIIDPIHRATSNYHRAWYTSQLCAGARLTAQHLNPPALRTSARSPYLGRHVYLHCESAHLNATRLRGGSELPECRQIFGLTGAQQLVRTQSLRYTARVSLSHTIRQKIESSAMSMAEISRRSCVSEGQISRFVRGERMLTAENLEHIANALGLEVVVRKARRRKAVK